MKKSVCNQKIIRCGAWKSSRFNPRIRFVEPERTHFYRHFGRQQTSTPLPNANFQFVRAAVALLIAFFLSTTWIHAETGPYTREFLRDEQRVFSVQVDRAQSEVKAAQDRLAVGLPSLAERDLILGFLYLDAANARMEGHEERITALRPAPLIYLRDKQIRLLTATCADLRAKCQRIENALYESATTQPAGVTNGWKAIPLYLVNRPNFARRFRDQSLSPDDLIADVQLLRDCPLPLVVSGMINSKNYLSWMKLGDGTWRSPNGVDFLSDGNLKPIRVAQVTPTPKPSNDQTATALKQMELKTSELEQTVNHLRTEQSNLFNGLSSRLEQTSKTPTNTVSVVTVQHTDTTPSATTQKANELSSTTNRPVTQVTQAVASVIAPTPTPTSPAPLETLQVNPKQASVASTVNTNNTAFVTANSVDRNTNNTDAKSDTASSARAVGTPASGTTTPAITGPSQPSRVVLILGGGVVLTLVIAVALGLAYINRRQSEFEMFLTSSVGGQAESITISLVPNEQCVVLGGDRPVLETLGAEDDQPSIVVSSLGGSQLRPGTLAEVRVNNDVVSKPKRLNAGDAIQVLHGGQSHTFTFQGGNFVSTVEQSASLESATSTIN